MLREGVSKTARLLVTPRGGHFEILPAIEEKPERDDRCARSLWCDANDARSGSTIHTPQRDARPKQERRCDLLDIALRPKIHGRRGTGCGNRTGCAK